jgi:hypothetical protein
VEGTRRLILVRAGNVAVRAEPAMDAPYRATFGRWPARVREDGLDVVIEYPRVLGARARRDQATVVLDGSVPWKVEARGPLRGLTADLAAGTLVGFEAQGAGDVTLSVPPPSGHVRLRFAAGISELTIHRPAGVEVGLRVGGGASRLRLDDQVFRAIGGETTLRTPGFESADDRYEVEVLRGASGLTLDAVAPARGPDGKSGRGLATVLFTDIVRSTERARELGDTRWRELLDAHDAIARRMVGDAGGELVKTTGDGILAVFEGPGPAIQAAVSFRREVREHEIEIRAGLHAGEIEYRGGDVGGIAVHTA